MAAIPRLQAWTGPALFSYGFRPFFLVGALYSGVAVLMWLPMLYGEIALSTAFAPRDWHVHEMLYGYVPAVLTGFLLTAIPNWTGRLPIQGMPLAGLFTVWLAGRVAVTVSAGIGWAAAAAIDGAFLLLVAAAAGREIMAGRNWRNLPVVALLTALAAGNIAFHLEAHLAGVADYAARFGIAVAVMLISLVGGRLIPSFTHNWLVRENPGRLPAPFGRFDVVVVAASGLALAAGSRRPPRWRPALRFSSPACSKPCVWRAGPATAPSATASCWCCISATPSFRSASCFPAPPPSISWPRPPASTRSRAQSAP